MISWLTMDVFDGLATLEDGSIDLVVTSPPFLALRSYLPADHPDKAREIGSEATPAEFLDTLLEVTAELRRVLAPHGSLCVELGDSYSGSGGAGGDYDEGGLRDGQPRFRQRNDGGQYGHWPQGGTKYNQDIRPITGGTGWPQPKSKALVPEAFRLALAYGFNPLTGDESPAGRWMIRNVVTWCRPNPPVGALGDKWRPATSDVVVACTSPKRFWDDLATRKPHISEWSGVGMRRPEGLTVNGGDNHREGRGGGEPNPSGAPLLDYWEIPLLDGEEPRKMEPKRGYDPEERRKRAVQQTTNHGGNKESRNDHGEAFYNAGNEAGAPLLDYWEIPPTGYAGAHYAVYPPALVEPLVKTMCPSRVCRTCGEPSRRIVESEQFILQGANYQDYKKDNTRGRLVPVAGRTKGRRQHADDVGKGVDNQGFISQQRTLGFTDCGHDDFRPGRVLDPFAGSGTTLAVASGHGHDAIGIDLDSRNEELARERVGPLLWETV